MNPILLLVIVALIILIILALWGRSRQNQGESGKDDGNNANEDVFTFTENTDESAIPVAARTVQIAAPVQTLRGKATHLKIVANPLSQVGAPVLPEGKGIDQLMVLVLNSSVRDSQTDDELYEFSPPLRMTINYKAADASKAPTDDKGVPRLSIVTGYQVDNGWRFERLPTTVTPGANGGGTLQANISTLHPQDPHWIGVP